MKEMNREMKLNMDELEQVNGGFRVCLGVGFSTDVEAGACFAVGKSTHSTALGLGANACAYIGAGIGFYLDAKDFDNN